MSYVYVVTLWVHTGDTNTQPGSGDTWSHVMTAASSPTHVTWAAGAGPGRLLPASAWWSESLSAPYTTLPSGWPGHSEALHRARHQHHHSTGQHTSASPTPPLSSLSALPQFFISTYLLLRDLEGLEVVADHPELLLQLHDLGLAGLGSLLRALEVGLHHGELPGDLGSSALDGALLS